MLLFDGELGKSQEKLIPHSHSHKDTARKKLIKRVLKPFFGRCSLRQCRNLILFCLFVTMVILIVLETSTHTSYTFIHKDIHSACVLPGMDTEDTPAFPYIRHPPRPVCGARDSLALFYLDAKNSLRFNYSVFNITDWRRVVNCTYKIVNYSQDGANVTAGIEVEFVPPLHVHANEIIITCRDEKRTVVYRDVFNRLEYRGNQNEREVREESEADSSILMLGINSLSRSSAPRKIPKTLRFLQNVMDAYVFKGFNTIGENTIENLLGIFTGKVINDTVYANDSLDYIPYFAETVQKFVSAGYITMHAEDKSVLNCTMLSDFCFSPTQPDLTHSWQQKIFRMSEAGVKLKPTACLGSKFPHVSVLEYYKLFLRTFQGKLKLASGFLKSLTTEKDVNFLEYTDEDLLEFLEWIRNNKLHENSFIILYSDHGSKKNRNTYTGRMEEKMPFLSIIVPRHIKTKHPGLHENLLLNTRRLASGIDIYQTMTDIRVKNLMQPRHVDKDIGRSLFQRVPLTRSCYDAMVSDEHCACSTSVEIEEEKSFGTIARFAIKKLNEHLRYQRDKCALFEIKKVSKIRQINDNLRRVPEKSPFSLFRWLFGTGEKYQVYRFNLEVTPSSFIFEMTVRKGERSMKLLDMDRIDFLRDDAPCMKDKILNSLCFCLS